MEAGPTDTSRPLLRSQSSDPKCLTEASASRGFLETPSFYEQPPPAWLGGWGARRSGRLPAQSAESRCLRPACLRAAASFPCRGHRRLRTRARGRRPTVLSHLSHLSAFARRRPWSAVRRLAFHRERRPEVHFPLRLGLCVRQDPNATPDRNSVRSHPCATWLAGPALPPVEHPGTSARRGRRPGE